MLCVLLLLPGVLGAALAVSVSGPKECAKGPAVWCQDLQAAMRCGAVGHCRIAVWSQPTTRSLPCDLCLDVAATASNGLNPEAAETDILAAVMKTCEWLPSQESSVKCKGMVDAHSSAILNMLSGDLGSAPRQVCMALTLCQPLQRRPATPGPLSEEDINDMVAPFVASGLLGSRHQRIPARTVCEDCVRLVTRLQGALGPDLSSLAQVTTREQCESLGPGLAFLCKNYIHQFLAPAEQTLRFMPPSEICENEGFCEERQGPAHSAHVAAVDGVPALELASPWKKSEVQMQGPVACDVCLQVVQRLDHWLESSSSKTLISQALERVCSALPPPVGRECIKLVDTYTPTLVDVLSRITPEKMCTVVRLCRAWRRARAVHEGPANLPPSLLDRDSLCRGCRRLFSLSVHNLEQKSTERRVLRAFKLACGILPLPFMVQCGRFVSEYQPVLMETLRDMMDPTTLCTKLRACRDPRDVLLGTDQCVLGPSFWCQSREAAQMCNTVEHCQRRVWREAPLRAESVGDPGCPSQYPPAPERPASP
nr:proactivator polypeptide-like 1 [Odocoileus virginianus texanus]